MINSLKCVDYVFLLDTLQTFEFIIEKIIPKFELNDLNDILYKKNRGIIFKNQFFKGKEDEVIGSKMFPVVIIPDVEELMSTSEAVKKIQSLMDK